jgi:fructose-bisphosphate aldolase, class II
MKTLREVIQDAEKRKVAVGHFNISNLEQLKAIARAARQLDVPAIIGVSEGERDYLGLHHVKDLVASYNTEHSTESGSFRLYLNADHTHSVERIKEAARMGFDEVLFDGASLPFEENVNLTRAAAMAARAMVPGVLVEGELGNIGSGSEIRKELPKGAAINPDELTKPEEAKRFVEATGIDLFAPAVGNIHGMFQNAPEPALDIPRISAIRKAAGVPLVLHGGSGNTDADFSAAIDAGVAVIHISTELRVAWRKGMEDSLKDHPGEVAPYKILPEAIAEIEKVVLERLRLFNRLNQ